VATVAGGGTSSAIVDVYTRRVPNALTLTLTIIGLALAALHVNGATLAGALGGFAIGLALMLPGHLVGATGAGDVKLFAALGTLLGPTETGMAFLYTAIAGGVLAVLVAMWRQRLSETLDCTVTLVRTAGSNVGEIERTSRNNRFGYAPAIAVGALIAVLGGVR